MGTFIGHAIPSIAYSLLALWWGLVTAIRCVRTEKNNKSNFKGSTYMPCFFCPTRKLRVFPIESVVKLVLLSFHASIEIYTGISRSQDGKLHFENENSHHICMISGFIAGSIIEILIYFGVPFPKKTEYMFNLLAFLIQGLLMTGHLNGDAGLEYQVHMLWTTIIVLNFFAACIETYNPDNVWAVYMRIFFFLTQGTWLMQVAFVVWPQTTNPTFIWKNDHTSHTWLSISLMYHLIGCAFLLMIQFLFVYCLFSFFDKYYQNCELDLENLSKVKLKGYDKNEENCDKKEYSFLINEDEDS